MSLLTDEMKDRLDQLVRTDRVVLFMKGSRTEPRCGFSARVVSLLDGLLDDYATVDVLADLNLREAMKEYASWPTFPQLWVDGELVGGSDIVGQLHESGQLFEVVRSRQPTPPRIHLTDAARDRIREVVGGPTVSLRLGIDAAFRYAFQEADEVRPNDVIVESNEVRLVLDRASARRADGMTMDFVQGPQGAGLVVDNPNEPPRVRQLDVASLRGWRERGEPHHLIDVRTDEEWHLARIEGARLLDPATEAWIHELPKEARLVFQCHHGMRSQQAAEHFLAHGFRHVYNLSGGIDAWSAQIDPDVPRY